MAALSMSLSLSSTRPGIKPARLTRATTRGRARVMTVSAVARARQAPAKAPAIKADAPPPATGTTTTPAGDAEGGYFGSGFDAPNEYGYFTSAITVAEQKRQDKLEAGGFKQIKGLTAEEEKARYAKLCSKHPESQRCAEGFSQKYVTKPATTSSINGSVVRSDGIILIPGNREDLITYVLDPKMSGDTIGLLIPGE